MTTNTQHSQDGRQLRSADAADTQSADTQSAGVQTAGVRPLHAVLHAFDEGATSIDDIVTRTMLSRDVVEAAIDHLRRLGRLEAKELSMGCPGGGCGSCASGHADGTAGCGAAGPSSQRRGPVLVQLRVRPGA